MSIVRFPPRMRLLMPESATAIEVCRDVDQLPPDLRERVLSARGLKPSEEQGDVGSAGRNQDFPDDAA